MLQGCHKGSVVSCGYAALVYEVGYGVEADPTRASQLRALACELGDEASCGGAR